MNKYFKIIINSYYILCLLEILLLAFLLLLVADVAEGHIEKVQKRDAPFVAKAPRSLLPRNVALVVADVKHFKYPLLINLNHF